jgi:hypothetical protein
MPGQRRGVGIGQRRIARLHRLRQTLGEGVRPWRGVHQQCGETGGAQGGGTFQRLSLRPRPAPCPIAPNIRAGIRQYRDHWRPAGAADRVGQRVRRVDAGGQRRGAAARQAGEAALGPQQRSGGRQKDLGALAAEGDQRDLIAPHIAVRQQQFDGALRLTQALHGGGAGGVHGEDRRGADALAEADDAEILAPHLEPLRRVGSAAQRLPGGGGFQSFQQMQPVAVFRLALPRPDRPSPLRARPSLRRSAGHPGLAAAAVLLREFRQQVRRKCGDRGFQHDIRQRLVWQRVRIVLRRRRLVVTGLRFGWFLWGRRFGLFGLRLGFRLPGILWRREAGRAGDEDEPSGEAEIGFVRRPPAVERGGDAGGTQRQQRCADRIDAQ